MNTWEDPRVAECLDTIGKSRLALAGLWTSACAVRPALFALDQGFEVYIIADACNDLSDETHTRGMQRMVQADAHPMTGVRSLLALQRDWARTATYDRAVRASVTHGGRYGLGPTPRPCSAQPTGCDAPDPSLICSSW